MAFFVAILLTAIQTGPGGSERLARYDEQLAAVLEWEILWDQTPAGFRHPTSDRITLAAYVEDKSFLYCSNELGVCAQYRVEPHRNWQRIKISASDKTRTDRDNVMNVAGINSRVPPQRGVFIGPGGFGGLGFGGMLWTTTIKLGTREEIARRYRQSPVELRQLEMWLRNSLSRSAGYTSVEIACFLDSDPFVYLYGNRKQGPIVITVYWDKEREDWVEAGLLPGPVPGPNDRQRIERIHSLIESVKCSTVNITG